MEETNQKHAARCHLVVSLVSLVRLCLVLTGELVCFEGDRQETLSGYVSLSGPALECDTVTRGLVCSSNTETGKKEIQKGTNTETARQALGIGTHCHTA